MESPGFETRIVNLQRYHLHGLSANALQIEKRFQVQKDIYDQDDYKMSLADEALHKFKITWFQAEHYIDTRFIVATTNKKYDDCF